MQTINKVPVRTIWLLTLALIFFIVVNAWLIYRLLPEHATLRLFWGLVHIDPGSESRLLLLVLLSGALGSFIFTARNFTARIGLQTFSYSWLWWHLTRPFIGSALAAIVYFGYSAYNELALFSGLSSRPAVTGITAIHPAPADSGELTPPATAPVSSGTSFTDSSSPGDQLGYVLMQGSESTRRKELFTLLFIASLAGLFANQTSDKLYDIFQSLFKTTTREDELRKNAEKENPGTTNPSFSNDAKG